MERPAPPDELTDKEKGLWLEIVGSRDPEFFDEATLPLLVEMCRAKSKVDVMADEINRFDPQWLRTDEGVKRYKELSSIQDKAQANMLSLARSMRLTPQARYMPDKKINRPTGPGKVAKPWESDV